MDCATARDLLSDEMDGRLAGADAARLAEHVASCPACAEERRGLASLRAAFRAMPRVAAPAGFRESVVSSLPRGRVLRLPRTLGWIAAVAAVVVVAVTLIPRDPSARERTVASAVDDAHVPEKRVSEVSGPAPAPAAAPLPAPQSPVPDGAESDRRRAAGARGGAPAKEETALEETRGRGEEQPATPGGDVPPADSRESADALAPADAKPAAPASRVRYVVFSDAAAAEKFAASLVAPPAAEEKDKDVPPIPNTGFAAPPELAAKSREVGGARAGAEDAARSADLLKRASFTSRRVLVRATLAAPVADEALVARARQAGGEMVRDDIEKEFAALLDAEPAGATPQSGGGTPAGGGGQGGGGKAGAALRDAPQPTARDDAKKAPLPLSAVEEVVVVLLEPPAPAKPAPAPPPRPGGPK